MTRRLERTIKVKFNLTFMVVESMKVHSSCLVANDETLQLYSSQNRQNNYLPCP